MGANCQVFSLFCKTPKEMLRVRHPQSAMGVRDVRHLDLPGVLREAPQPGRAPVLCTLGDHGQVEGHRVGEDESGRQSQCQGVLRGSGGLE